MGKWEAISVCQEKGKCTILLMLSTKRSYGVEDGNSFNTKEKSKTIILITALFTFLYSKIFPISTRWPKDNHRYHEDPRASSSNASKVADSRVSPFTEGKIPFRSAAPPETTQT